MLELLALLLPIAALSGWCAAMRHIRRQHESVVVRPDVSSLFGKGMNYLLNEQPDKAVDCLVGISEHLGDSAESQLALGNLFRRAGEVEQAISLHRRLVTLSSLSKEQHKQAMYELGIDFMRAGLFDRAETIFEELKYDIGYGEPSTQQLLQIYQHEKDWIKAIECARILTKSDKILRGESVSQFLCEMAEAALQSNDLVTAMTHLENALEEDSSCVRASLLSAQIYIMQGGYRCAVSILQCVANHNPSFIPEIIDPLMDCYSHLDCIAEQIDCLRKIQQQHPLDRINSILAQLIQKSEGASVAEQFMWKEMEKLPSLVGFDRLLALLIDQPEKNINNILKELKQLSARLTIETNTHRCSHCGFSGQQLHWRCPGCHHWESIKPYSAIGN